MVKMRSVKGSEKQSRTVTLDAGAHYFIFNHPSIGDVFMHLGVQH